MNTTTYTPEDYLFEGGAPADVAADAEAIEGEIEGEIEGT